MVENSERVTTCGHLSGTAFVKSITLYTTYRNKRRVRCHSEGRIRVTVWRDRKPLRREMRENTQDGTPGSWFKITVSFHYVKNRARFFVQGASTASALKDVSYKICDEENEKVAIFVNPSTVPYSVLNKLEPKEMEQLKLTLNKRYNVSQQALDLQNLRFDPDLVGHDIDIILNRRNCMAATLQIIEKDFPELLSLNLSSNKLYHLDGLSDIIQMAPTVKILNLCKNEDGQELPSPIMMTHDVTLRTAVREYVKDKQEYEEVTGTPVRL
ncbi:Nuclear RNA export factor 2 [Camelus dromedarius]|uniref:Nuclear RNA export factor 2 n=1 Tax=Camelus dromedarius TaxID=9838 RepID=A0A5N4C1W3_CAMDR|nr:Nuclear RNA export factor 2 [Camelus dromedarius]